jgi:hypothetical protein
MAAVEGEALQNHGEPHLNLEQREVLLDADVGGPYEWEKLWHVG